MAFIPILVCWLTWNVGFARADEDDDRINNLVTDLAPLIALFGEKVVMQFMSQSLGLSDCTALAMAPLGIIPIVVGAIRVGGPHWLKAIIGRVRENISIVEIELMSSTSKDASELWNGRNVVRCPGSASIKQFICLIPNDNPEGKEEAQDFDFQTLEQAQENGLLKQIYIPISQQVAKKYPWHEVRHCVSGSRRAVLKWLRNIPKNMNKRKCLTSGDVEHGNCTDLVTVSPEGPSTDKSHRDQENQDVSGTSPHPDPKCTIICDVDGAAPNVTLNCHDRVNRLEIILLAAFGVAIQVGVLVFCGLITLNPSISPKFLKNGRPVQPHALPLTICGTVILTIGIFLCGRVVEVATIETYFEPHQDYSLFTVWLQKGGTFNDQEFEPFAVYPSSERSHIISSRRRNRVKRDSKDGKDGKDGKDNATFGLETMTVVGSCISMAGFVLQFVGFRDMNWAAPAAQLIAMAIMTFLRVVVRRGVAKPPDCQPLTSNFELDWFAASLSNFQKAPWWSHGEGKMKSALWKSRGSKDSQDTESVLKLEDRREGISKDSSNVLDEAIHPFKIQRVAKLRRELAKLANWHGPASSQAVALSKAIEVFARHIIKQPSERNSMNPIFSWKHDITINGQPSQFSFQMEFIKGEWMVRSDDIEAAISLWMYPIWRQEYNSSAHLSSESDVARGDGWLRVQDTKQAGLRLLGATTENIPLNQDLLFWMHGDAPPLLTVSEIQEEETVAENTTRQLKLLAHRVVGSLGEGSARSTPNELRSFNVHELAYNTMEAYDAFDSHDSLLRLRSQTRKNQEMFGTYLKKRGLLMDTDGSQQKTRKAFAVESFDSLERLLARDIFHNFVAAAGSQNVIEWRTNTILVHDETAKVWRQLKLKNESLSKLADSLSNTGFLSLKEAYFDLIVPLSTSRRLPEITPVVDFMREELKKTVMCPQPLKFAETTTLVHSLLELTMVVDDENNPIVPRVLSICAFYKNLLNHLYKIYRRETSLEFPQAHEMECSNDLLTETYRSRCFPSERLESVFKGQFDVWDSKHHHTSPSEDKLAGKGSEEAHFPSAFKLSWRHLQILDYEKYQSLEADENDNPGVQDAFGCTAAHYLAALEDARRMPEEAIQKTIGTQMHERDIFGLSPLHYACRERNHLVVELLFVFGASVDVISDNGLSPMHFAALTGDVNMVKLLLSPPESIVQQKTFVVAGIQTSKSSKARDPCGKAPIHWAAMKGHVDVVRLLKSELNVKDAFGMTCLHLAIIYGHTELVNVLISEFEVDLNSRRDDNKGPMDLSVAHGHKHITKMIALAAIDRAKNGTKTSLETPLPCFVSQIDLDILRQLVTSGASDISKSDDEGSTVFHKAAESLNRELLEYLFELDRDGSLLSTLNKRGEHTLSIAVYVSSSSKQSMASSIHFINRILDKMVPNEIHHQDKWGATALSTAMEALNVEIVRVLLQRGAGPSLKLKVIWDWTPVDWIKACVNPEIANRGMLKKSSWDFSTFKPEKYEDKMAIYQLAKQYADLDIE